MFSWQNRITKVCLSTFFRGWFVENKAALLKALSAIETAQQFVKNNSAQNCCEIRVICFRQRVLVSLIEEWVFEVKSCDK